LDGLDAVLRHHHGLTGGQIHQLEQRLEAGNIPIFGAFKVLEVLEISHRSTGETGKTGGVEFRPRDGEHSVAVIDERGQSDTDPDGFKAVFIR